MFNKEIFDIDILVREIINDITAGDKKRHIVFKKSRKPVIVFADRGRIGQVLINLLGNALKYSDVSKKVIVSTKGTAENITVSVKDFGEGISPEDQKKIFERFNQIRKYRQKHFPSLGLGLYISSRIINSHNGSIRVESVNGEGSTFHFSLPRRFTSA